jgi:hypothetical protein
MTQCQCFGKKIFNVLFSSIVKAKTIVDTAIYFTCKLAMIVIYYVCDVCDVCDLVYWIPLFILIAWLNWLCTHDVLTSVIIYPSFIPLFLPFLAAYINVSFWYKRYYCMISRDRIKCHSIVLIFLSEFRIHHKLSTYWASVFEFVITFKSPSIGIINCIFYTYL